MSCRANLKNNDQPFQDQLNPVDDEGVMFMVMPLTWGVWAVSTDLQLIRTELTMAISSRIGCLTRFVHSVYSVLFKLVIDL